MIRAPTAQPSPPHTMPTSPPRQGSTLDAPDRDSLIEVFNQDDPLHVIIRGHLRVESLLIRLIEEDLKVPEALDVTSLNFPTKVDLAIALKLIPPHWDRILRRLNQIRNRFAHKIESDVTQQDIDVIWEALDEHGRAVLKEADISSRPPRGQLGGILLIMYFSMERFRQFHADRRAGRLLIEDEA